MYCTCCLNNHYTFHQTHKMLRLSSRHSDERWLCSCFPSVHPVITRKLCFSLNPLYFATLLPLHLHGYGSFSAPSCLYIKLFVPGAKEAGNHFIYQHYQFCVLLLFVCEWRNWQNFPISPLLTPTSPCGSMSRSITSLALLYTCRS